MSGKAKTERSVEHDEHFLLYPLHSVGAVFENENDALPAIDELREFGFANKDIESYCGSDGERRLDLEGTFHGRWTSVLRSLQALGPDRTHIVRYEKYLEEGHCIVMVHVSNKRRKGTATDILKRHTSKPVTYFGVLTIEDA